MVKTKTQTEKFLQSRHAAPHASEHMSKVVSQYRREVMEEEVARGDFKEKGNSGHHSHAQNENIKTSAGNVISNQSSFTKSASGTPGSGTGAGAGSYRGSGGSLRQIPEIYSPLWLNSNLNLPRDRATINAWSRAFFALNPIVHNAISLHATYPISKLNIKCKDEKIQTFFEDMNEEINLINVCIQMAQEYWLLGETFVYGELDENTAKWSRLLIQNPDYMVVKHSVIAGEPVLSLRPDENLKRIVTSNRPSDIQQRHGLDPGIVEHVRRGENIPLSNFYASHLARRISPYETRGTGLVVPCFRHLMLYDKLRESKFAQADNMINPLTLVKVGGGTENYKANPADLDAWREVFECHDEKTEVLTDQGFKTFEEVIEYQEVMDGTCGIPHIYSAPRAGVKIACFNSDTEELEYHSPSNSSLYNYDGDMYHFKNNKMDIKVTPNHKMWVSEKEYEYHGHKNARKAQWKQWEKIDAQDIKLTDYSRFRSDVKWVGNDDIKEVNVLGNKVSIELYLEFLGYVLSEGCVYSDKNSKFVGICQNTTINGGAVNEHYPVMKRCIEDFGNAINLKKHYEHYRPASKEENRQETWSYNLISDDIYDYFKNEIGTIEGTKSKNKYIPKWVLNLSPRLLNILIKALVRGDGSDYERPVDKSLHGYAYYTISKQLSDDVYEAVYKTSNVPTMFVRDDYNYLYRNGTINEPRNSLYTICWSNSTIGNSPLVYKYSTNPRTKKKTPIINKEHYTGKVWCFTVPTGLFVTRRNGKITIQGNSAQYDKDFKIFTHDAVTVERVGFNSGIIDISNDITQILKEVYVGLMVPQVVMDGGSDVTYANGGVTLDVLRQRYMQFREMMSVWLRRKIFAPISEINEFYERKDGKKVLIVPDVEWNYMSLFDAGDYIQTLTQLAQGQGSDKKVSTHTVFRSLGIEWEDEKRKLKIEAIQDAINEREKAALLAMPLNELRSLGPEDSIEEPEEEELPGESSALPGMEEGMPGAELMPEGPMGGDAAGGLGSGGEPPLMPEAL